MTARAARAVLLLLVGLALAAPAARAADRPSITAPSAIVVDAQSGDVAYAKDADARRPIASTTKLMTALLTLEKGGLSDVVTVKAYRGSAAESVLPLVAGEKMTVADLLRALLLRSANDAAVALAVRDAGSVPAFVRQMNRRARQLGMENTNFGNPIGLDTGDNYSSARDLATLTLALRKNRFFRRTVNSQALTLRSGVRERRIENRNTLLDQFGWVDGVKTGHTNAAGWCMVSSGRKRGISLVAVELGAPSEASRDDVSTALLNYGFTRYVVRGAIERDDIVARLPIEDRAGATLPISASRTVRRVLRKGERFTFQRRYPEGRRGPDRLQRRRRQARRGGPRQARRHRPAAGDALGPCGLPGAQGPGLAARAVDADRARRCAAGRSRPVRPGARRRPALAARPQRAARGRADVIITVTLNAAIDKTLAVPSFQPGRRHRTTEQTSMPGGKGINVARVLKTLGQPVIATGFAGGPTGTRIVEQLTDLSVLCDLVRIKDESRTNTALVDPTTGLQTEVNERGPSVTETEVELFVDKLLYLAKGASMCVFAGSLPRGVEPELYGRLIREVKRLGVETIVDTDGDPLHRAVRAEPHVISPNVLEAEELVGHEFNDSDDTLLAVAEMCELGASEAIMTVPDGCVARLEDGTLWRGAIPRVEPTATIGSGDAFLAGFVSARYSGKSSEQCLAYGVACGAESTQHLGAGVVDPAQVGRLLGEVDVRRVHVAGVA